MSLLNFFSLFKSSKKTSDKKYNCCLCKKLLSGKIIRDSWGNSAHLTHPISFCSSCQRILSPYSSGGAYQYSDGRKICGLCKKISIQDAVSVNRCRRKVLAQLEKIGFSGIPKNIEIVLAHPKTLSAHSRKRGTAGLTLSHVHFSRNKRIGMSHQIGVLHGLPKIECEAIIAHELLHVWQHENHIKFSPLYSEGLCELGAYLIYSEDSSDLSNLFIQRMKVNEDPVYGNGFRLMLKKLEANGWRTLIREILNNKHGFESSILNKIFGKS